MDIPAEIGEKLKNISNTAEIPYEEIADEYQKTFCDDFIQKDPQFKTDDERHHYTSMILTSRYLSRPPAKVYDVIPVGFSGVRNTKKGPMSEIFAFAKQIPDGQTEFRRIVCRDDMATIYKNLTLFALYNKVKMGAFSGAGGDLIVDKRTQFVNPIMGVDNNQLLANLPAKRLKLADVTRFPSRKNDAGYTDSCDWRVVRGIVLRTIKKEKEPGRWVAGYTLLDDSISPERKVLDDGNVQSPGFTVWCAPEQVIYDTESEIEIYGTITINEDGSASMNGYLVHPIFARPRPE